MDQEDVLIGILSIAGQPIIIHSGGEIYDGPYHVTPMAYNSQTLYTRNKTMINNVTVFRVPYFEVSNEKGKTVYIAQEVNNG